MNKILITPLLICLCNTAIAQYVNQTTDIYSNKAGNLYVKASYTSTNRGAADRTIYLKSRNENSNSRDMLTWTNGGYKEVKNFMYELIYGLEKGKDASFQINFMHRATVVDANNLKVFHLNGGFSHFNRKQILLLLEAIKGME